MVCPHHGNSLASEQDLLVVEESSIEEWHKRKVSFIDPANDCDGWAEGMPALVTLPIVLIDCGFESERIVGQRDVSVKDTPGLLGNFSAMLTRPL